MCSTTAKGAEELSRLVNTGCKLVGCGSAVPSLRVSNNDLPKIIDINDDWISVWTGIHNRRVLSAGGFKNSLAIIVDVVSRFID
ncbi:3-oxoacyl-[acyl-carrier-protein] synthase III, chloroplastic [Capsicum chinense]|nr:3-oxoacyl-[acyl-carrier-protein] synthase III, chloroplastic [Capsicum chinense]